MYFCNRLRKIIKNKEQINYMKTRNFHKIMMLLLMLMVSGVGYAQTKIDGIWYELDKAKGNAEVAPAKDGLYSGSVVIPSVVTYEDKEYNVTSIGDEAFCDCIDITSISIPSSVRERGIDAFFGCEGIKEVFIDVVKAHLSESIVKNICKNSKQKVSLTIGNSVTGIGSSAFKDLENLVSVTIGNSVKSIGSEAFRNCIGLTSVTFGGAVETIDYSAFSGCKNLTSINLPESVKVIDNEVFSGCAKLESVNIPKSLTRLGGDVFGGCNELKTLIIDCELNNPDNLSDLQYLGTKWWPRPLETVIIGNSVTSIGEAFFRGWCFKSVKLGNSVKEIGNDAFNGCKNLTSINIPESVTAIGWSAFEGCSSLSSITIPSSVKEIKNYTFKGCGNLTSVTIPNSVTSIGISAFYADSALISITIPSSVTSIGENAFCYCSGFNSIVVDKENKVYDSRNDCNAIINTSTNELIWGCKNTVIPNTVTSIADYAFLDCFGLTSVIIPESVTSIGEGAFYECSGLTSVTIGNSVKSIGGAAFYFCTGLTSVSFGNSVKSIGPKAFNNCSALTSVILPESLTRIEPSVFFFCSALTSVTIPESVTTIGTNAFKGCEKLSSIKFPNSLTDIEQGAFGWCSGLTSVIIPESVTSIGENAFYADTAVVSISVEKGNKVFDSRDNCNAVINTTTNELVVGCKNTVIPESVTSIGNSAFSVCETLTSIVIPESVTSIGENAFWKCTGLTSITIPESVKTIGEYAFYECTNLKSVTNLSKTPQTITLDTFYGYRGIDLYVPVGCKDVYKSSDIWNDFKVHEIGETGEEPTDADVAKNVIDMIATIGTVENTDACKSKIEDARKAYDSLTKEQQTLVKNYNLLVEAEDAYKQLVGTGIIDINSDNVKNNGKYLENGKIVIIRNDKKFNINGLVE